MKFTDEQINYMVSRFLAWELPKDFYPDGGVVFAGPYEVDARGYQKHHLVGTNLFTASQAESMIRYILGEER